MTTDIGPEEIQAELEKILAAPGFVGASRLSQFLRYTIDQYLINPQHQIKQYTIGVEGLGLPEDFDPQKNPIVRKYAQRLRRALLDYYSTEGADDPIRILIPKGGYSPQFQVNDDKAGLTAGPLQKTKDSSDYNRGPAIAVIALDNLTGSEESGYIARGLTSEIIVSLTRFIDLIVLGPLDNDRLKREGIKNTGPHQSLLYILSGGIRANGAQVRITIELSEAKSQQNLWAKSFGFHLEKTSLFDIEEQVSDQVVGAIADSLGVIFRRLQTESYRKSLTLSSISSAILKYNNAWMTQAPQAWSDAFHAVNDTLERHPKNALMTALLANIYYADALFGLHLIDHPEELMEQLAIKAVALDPELQLARYNMVVMHSFFSRADECIAEARKTVELNPNHARILGGSAVAVTVVGAYDYGLELIDRAKRLNPHYPGWYHFIDYLVHYAHERYELAWRNAQLIYVKGTIWHPLLRAAVLGKLGQAEMARPFIEELTELKPDFTQRPREYIRPLVVTDENVNMLLDGLHKAGVEEV